MSERLRVDNIPQDATEEHLQAFFSERVPIRHVRIPRNDKNESCGYVLVYLAQEQVSLFTNTFNNVELDGKKLRVKPPLSKSKSPEPKKASPAPKPKQISPGPKPKKISPGPKPKNISPGPTAAQTPKKTPTGAVYIHTLPEGTDEADILAALSGYDIQKVRIFRRAGTKVATITCPSRAEAQCILRERPVLDLGAGKTAKLERYFPKGDPKSLPALPTKAELTDADDPTFLVLHGNLRPRGKQPPPDLRKLLGGAGISRVENYGSHAFVLCESAEAAASIVATHPYLSLSKNIITISYGRKTLHFPPPLPAVTYAWLRIPPHLHSPHFRKFHTTIVRSSKKYQAQCEAAGVVLVPRMQDFDMLSSIAPPKPIEQTPLTIVETQAALSLMIAELRSSHVVAINAPFSKSLQSTGTYALSFSTPDHDFIIDCMSDEFRPHTLATLACEEHPLAHPLSALNEICASPDIVKVMFEPGLQAPELLEKFGIVLSNCHSLSNLSRALKLSPRLHTMLQSFCVPAAAVTAYAEANEDGTRNGYAEPAMMKSISCDHILTLTKPYDEEEVKYARYQTHFLIYIDHEMLKMVAEGKTLGKTTVEKSEDEEDKEEEEDEDEDDEGGAVGGASPPPPPASLHPPPVTLPPPHTVLITNVPPAANEEYFRILFSNYTIQKITLTPAPDNTIAVSVSFATENEARHTADSFTTIQIGENNCPVSLTSA